MGRVLKRLEKKHPVSDLPSTNQIVDFWARHVRLLSSDALQALPLSIQGIEKNLEHSLMLVTAKLESTYRV